MRRSGWAKYVASCAIRRGSVAASQGIRLTLESSPCLTGLLQNGLNLFSIRGLRVDLDLRLDFGLAAGFFCLALPAAAFLPVLSADAGLGDGLGDVVGRVRSCWSGSSVAVAGQLMLRSRSVALPGCWPFAPGKVVAPPDSEPVLPAKVLDGAVCGGWLLASTSGEMRNRSGGPLSPSASWGSCSRMSPLTVTGIVNTSTSLTAERASISTDVFRDSAGVLSRETSGSGVSSASVKLALTRAPKEPVPFQLEY